MLDFLIVGGGINGLLLARELAGSAAEVVLLDQGKCGREASWAGGGIVSPLYPWRYPPEITALASWAQEFYPSLVHSLEEETGIDAELQRSGLLMLAAEETSRALSWAQTCGRRMEALTSTAIYTQVPRLAPGFESALWMPDVSNVRNPRLIKALLASLTRAPNVRILEDWQLHQIDLRDGTVKGVSIRQGSTTQQLQARQVILCTGAWTGRVLQAQGIDLPIEPVKGQMLLFKLQANLFNSILLTAGRYLIPRADGHVLAGSTLEYCDFDKTATAEGREQLWRSACALLPELRQQQPVAQWAGLRPGAPQGVPFIGRLPTIDNLYVNAGQFRNGLVLAPASCRLLADILLKRAPILDPQPYAPDLHKELVTGRKSSSPGRAS